MEKVIYLEADEEITSVIDRIKDIKEESVALVLPKRANLLQSIVNLKLLKRQIDGLGKEVTIVTTDRLGRNLASQVGFIVYQKMGEKPVEVAPKPNIPKSVEPEIGYRKPETPLKREPHFNNVGPSVADITYRKEDERKTTPLPLKKETLPISMHKEEEPKAPSLERPVQHESHKEKPKVLTRPLAKKATSKKPKINKKVALIIGICLFLVAAIILFVILPRANITLAVKGEVVEKTIDAGINQETKSPNFEKAILPGEVVSGEKEATSKNLPCTGKKNVGQKASGTVTLSNAYDENPQGLVANTRLVSTANGKTYRLTESVNIPGAKVSGGNVVPGTVTANIQAADPGADYNIESSHFTIPGLSGSDKYDKVYGDTASPIKGGFTEEVTVLSQSDIDTNKNKIVADLTKQIENELNTKYKDKKVFISGITPQVLEVAPNIPPDTESAKFDLKVKVKIVTMATSKKDYDYMIFKKLTAYLPNDKDLVQGELKDLSYKVITFEEKSGKMAIQIMATGTVITKVDQDKVKEAIGGKSQQSTSQYLSNLKDVTEVRVTFWPFWVRSVPRLFKNNTKIEIDVKR